MQRLANYVTTAVVAGAIALGTLTAASAQTWNNSWDNGWNNNRGYNSTWNAGWGNGWNTRPLVSTEVGLNTGYGYAPGYDGSSYSSYGGGLVTSPVAGRGSIPPGTNGYGYGCATDEGYGRTLPCDHGGGF